MNIKNRIEKLETNRPNPGGFCVCFGSQPLSEVFLRPAGGELTPLAKPLPDDCESCGLKINKGEPIIVEGVESNIPIPEGAGV